jgi:hypothetical protein
MLKPVALHLVIGTSAIFLLCGGALNGDNRSIAQATVQQPESSAKMRQFLASQTNTFVRRNCRLASTDVDVETSGTDAAAEADFSSRLQGGDLLRFDDGVIVVQPTNRPESTQPTALTADAIITSSIKSRIAAQAQLQAQNFDIETDNGVVKIHAKEQSLDQALRVINIALALGGVRQIIYTMPTGYQAAKDFTARIAPF